MSHARGRWTFLAAEVVARTDAPALAHLDLRAPVIGGHLAIDSDTVRVTVRVAVGDVRTGNFLIETAARSALKRTGADSLDYSGEGPAGAAPWRVSGAAALGPHVLSVALLLTPVTHAGGALSAVAVSGVARLGPRTLPGLGRVDDLRVSVDSHVPLEPATA